MREQRFHWLRTLIWLVAAIDNEIDHIGEKSKAM